MDENLLLAVLICLMVPCWIVAAINQVLMIVYRKPGVSWFGFFVLMPSLLTEQGLRARTRFLISGAAFLALPFLGLLIKNFLFPTR